MPKLTAKQSIGKGKWVNCWICEDIFKRRRQTLRYCYHCEQGFCEGEHGTLKAGGLQSVLSASRGRSLIEFRTLPGFPFWENRHAS